MRRSVTARDGDFSLRSYADNVGCDVPAANAS